MRKDAGYTAKSRILSLVACGFKQQPPSLLCRVPPPRLGEPASTGGRGCVGRRCGWPLVIFIGRVYRRAHEARKREGKKCGAGEKKAGRRASQSSDSFSALISRGDERISTRGAEFFAVFSDNHRVESMLPRSHLFPTLQ